MCSSKISFMVCKDTSLRWYLSVLSKTNSTHRKVFITISLFHLESDAPQGYRLLLKTTGLRFRFCKCNFYTRKWVYAIDGSSNFRGGTSIWTLFFFSRCSLTETLLQLAIHELETEATRAWHGMNTQNQLYAFINKRIQDFEIILKSCTFWSRQFAYL
jgi:hypothetical protein